MENKAEHDEVLQPETHEECPNAAPSTETVQPEDHAFGFAYIDFTADELHMVIAALIAHAEHTKSEFPVHRSFQDRADKFLELAMRLDEEYDESFPPPGEDD